MTHWEFSNNQCILKRVSFAIKNEYHLGMILEIEKFESHVHQGSTGSMF